MRRSPRVNEADRCAVRDVRGGDSEAFGRIVRAYQGRLFGLVLTVVREPAAAEEITQDSFLRAYRHLDRYDDDRPFYPWLATIAVRLAQNWLRQRADAALRGDARVRSSEPSVPASVLNSLLADERGRRLWQEVAALSSGQRTAVALYYRDGMPVGDIAVALGVTPGTVKTFLFRARRRLRERLEGMVPAYDEVVK